MAARKRKSQQGFPGWAWMLFGLSIGLSVALSIYLHDRVLLDSILPEVPAPAIRQSDDTTSVDRNDESSSNSRTEGEEERFTFYEMLPRFEVVIPDQEPDVKLDSEPQAIDEPGIYVLQAGSFSEYADADRRRAVLAMQGIESHIQRVSIDDRTYHRVRIGPIDDLEELNVTRSRLRAARIDVLRIRLGD